MKTIYKCEICGTEFDTEEKAQNCEAQGVMKQVFPVGMIFGHGHDGYKRMVFAVAKVYSHGHDATYAAWACRDTEAGDNSPLNEKNARDPKNTCGFSVYASKRDEEHRFKYTFLEPDTSIPAFKRMVKLLKFVGITPTVLKEKKAVPIGGASGK